MRPTSGESRLSEVVTLRDDNLLPPANTSRGNKGRKQLGRAIMLLVEAGSALVGTEVKVNLALGGERRREAIISSQPLIEPSNVRTDLVPPAPHYEISAGRETFAIRILKDALDRFRSPDGYEGDLVDAAWQLEQIGKDAWLALATLAFSHTPETEFFLAAMVRIEGMEVEDRRLVLLVAARNPDINVRSRLLELVDELPIELQTDVVRALASQDRPDDGVTDRAREALTVLECQAN